ncbi:hypothetical protein [Spirosoma horti]
MVWKLYRMMAVVLFRCAVAACFDRTSSGELGIQINRLYRLKRIVICVRQYYGLHPNFAKDTYGTMENYLRQHISDHDWVLLTHLQVIKPNKGAVVHNPFLDIA